MCNEVFEAVHHDQNLHCSMMHHSLDMDYVLTIKSMGRVRPLHDLLALKMSEIIKNVLK